jgi:hypothetical protein
MEVVPVARKINRIEERRQDQRCLSRRGDYGNKGQNHEQSALSSSTGEDFFCRSVIKHDRRTALRICKHVSIYRISPKYSASNIKGSGTRRNIK